MSPSRSDDLPLVLSKGRTRARRRVRKPLPPNWRWIALSIAWWALIAVLNVLSISPGGALIAAGCCVEIGSDVERWRLGGFMPWEQRRQYLVPFAVLYIPGLVLSLSGH